MLFKSVGVKDSNEAEILAILKALRMYACSFQELLIIESDSADAISLASGR